MVGVWVWLRDFAKVVCKIDLEKSLRVGLIGKAFSRYNLFSFYKCLSLSNSEYEISISIFGFQFFVLNILATRCVILCCIC